MKKSIAAILTTSLGVLLLAGCGQKQNVQDTTAATTAAAQEQSTPAETTPAEGTQTETPQTETTPAEPAPAGKKIVIGASPAPHGEILEAVREQLNQQGYELDIREYTDYVQPNNALEMKDLDANYFQHLPYLLQFNEQNGTNLVSAGVIHYEPFGIYAGKTADLAQLADGAKVAVPNDVTNEARALLLLEAQGLIKLKEGADLNATKNDIIENSKNLDIVEIEAAQIPRALPDVDIAVINGNYAIEAGLKVSDALAVEASDSVAATTYGNIVAVRAGEENDEAVKALVDALKSPELKEFINTTYDGAVVPMD